MKTGFPAPGTGAWDSPPVRGTRGGCEPQPLLAAWVPTSCPLAWVPALSQRCPGPAGKAGGQGWARSRGDGAELRMKRLLAGAGQLQRIFHPSDSRCSETRLCSRGSAVNAGAFVNSLRGTGGTSAGEGRGCCSGSLCHPLCPVPLGPARAGGCQQVPAGCRSRAAASLPRAGAGSHTAPLRRAAAGPLLWPHSPHAGGRWGGLSRQSSCLSTAGSGPRDEVPAPAGNAASARPGETGASRKSPSGGE